MKHKKRRAIAAKKAPKRPAMPLYAFRLEPHQIQALRDEAVARGVTVSDLLREGVSDVFDRRAGEVIRRKESERKGNPHIALRLQPDQIEALRKEATNQYTTMSDIIRRSLLGVFIRHNLGLQQNPTMKICPCRCDSGMIHE